DHVEQVVGCQVLYLLHLGDRLVDGHGPDGDRRSVDDRLADRVDVAPGGEVHDRVGAVVDRVVQLLELLVDIRLDGGVADVGVDLHARQLADRHGIEPPGEVVYVGGNDQPPAGHLVAHQLDGKRFPP